MENGMRVIWPTKRFIPEAELRGFFKDAVADGEIELDKDENPDTLELGFICVCLEDIGWFTFAADKKVDEEAGNYITLEECKASGQHLESCDDDGYCNSCGEQD